MGAGLYRVVFGGQSECVEAYREQDVVALHPALARHNVHGGVRSWMTHMQALAGGVRELHKCVIFWAGIACHSRVGLLVKPSFLPLFFYPVKFVVGHCNNLSFCIVL